MTSLLPCEPVGEVDLGCRLGGEHARGAPDEIDQARGFVARDLARAERAVDFGQCGHDIIGRVRGRQINR
jgi:hypothetical protein